MGEQQSSLSAPPAPAAAAAAEPPSPAGSPREPGADEPPLREAAGPGQSGEPPPLPERRGTGGDEEEEEEEAAAGPEQPAEEGPGPEGGSGRRRPPRRHVYCTVYCVENDRPAARRASPPSPGGGGGVGRAPAPLPAPVSVPVPVPAPSRRGVAAGGDPLAAGGSVEVVDLYLLPEPFSGLIAGDFGPLLVLSCRVCLEEKPVKPLSCCKKAVCEECLKRYLSSQVRPQPRGTGGTAAGRDPGGRRAVQAAAWPPVCQPECCFKAKSAA